MYSPKEAGNVLFLRTNGELPPQFELRAGEGAFSGSAQGSIFDGKGNLKTNKAPVDSFYVVVRAL